MEIVIEQGKGKLTLVIEQEVEGSGKWSYSVNKETGGNIAGGGMFRTREEAEAYGREVYDRCRRIHGEQT